MISKKSLKLIIWLILSINLLAAFFLGIMVSSQIFIPSFIEFIIIPLIILLDYIILNYFKIGTRSQVFSKKILIWWMLIVNLLFAFLIGFTIPSLVSDSRDNLGYLMIPLLVILNYIILDRFHYYQKHITNSITNNLNTENESAS